MTLKAPNSTKAKHIDIFPYTDEEKNDVFEAIKASFPKAFHQLLDDAREDYLGKWLSTDQIERYGRETDEYTFEEFRIAYEQIIAPLVNSLYRPHVNDFKSFQTHNPGNAFTTLGFDVWVGRWTKKSLFDVSSSSKTARRLNVDRVLRNNIFDVFAKYAGEDYSEGYRSNETIEVRLKK